MKEENQKWINLLENANSRFEEQLSTGEILSVNLFNQGATWRLRVKLEEVLTVSDIRELMKELRNYLICGDNGIEKVEFIFTYENQNCSGKLVEEYFQNAITECQEIKKSVCILNEYRHEIMGNCLSVYVATEGDKTLVAEVLEAVKANFAGYGLDSLEVGVFISPFEVSIKEREEEKIRLKEQTADAMVFEHQRKAEVITKSANDKVEYKQKKSHVSIASKIKDLPITSMQVFEFRQKNGTEYVVVTGVIIEANLRKAGNYNLFEGIVTDYEDSIVIKKFYRPNEEKIYKEQVVPGKRVEIKGAVQYDTFAKDVVIMIQDITILGDDVADVRFDEAEVKRVELHAHSKMSTLDSVLDVEEYVKRAKAFGHKALAITDHANCHAMPELFNFAKKNGLKPIMGVEGYYVDDDHYQIAFTDESIDLNEATYVIYDLETSGLSANYNEIIEIGAVKMRKGIVIDHYSTFIKPNKKLGKVTIDLTGITDEDLVAAPKIEEELPKFKAFIEGCILIAHNASFDNSFLYENLRRLNLYEKDYPTIDTLQMARVLYNDRLKQFNLKAVAKALKVEIDVQHRAVADAQTCSNIFLKMLGDISDLHITNYAEINSLINRDQAFKYVFPYHINLLVKNDAGRKNFNKVISDSHTIHYYKEPRVLKSVIQKYREGLLVGSGCSNGEIFTIAYERSLNEMMSKMDFYDYIEVQPPQAYFHLVEASGDESIKDAIYETIRLIIKAADAKGKMVVATGDVHHLDEKDKIYRQIYFTVARPGGGVHELVNIKNPPSKHFMTTTEMLKAFDFLGFEKAYEIVVTNTNKIADMISEFELFPKTLCVPRDDFMSKYGIPSMKEAVREKSYQTARQMYGEDLPQYIKDRLEVELKSIIGNGYSSVYYISHMLVKKSMDNGYIVGSRGSVGSSFVATMMRITEVNPLSPHYCCPKCHYLAFKFTGANKDKYSQDLPADIEEALNKVTVGFDLEEKNCPRCGTLMDRDGVDIPFETFLGFDGDKVPDIDLNFSGEYQDKAHLFTREVFGMDNAFRAGTIGTVAEKTAYGYVRGYFENHGQQVREAEIKRIASKITGVKRTTGSHPGGIVVVPDYIEYTDIIPVQYPADDPDSTWRTSHYDYHSFESALLKLDILGHDDPTVIKHLMDYVFAEPDHFPFAKVEDIPLSDFEVLSLFNSIKSLKIDYENYPEVVGTIGIPEFGTNFVREMLKDIKPQNFSDIIRISGLSHGTDVWLGNAKELVMTPPGTESVPFSDIIGCRDDIMVYLLSKNLPAKSAFQIMEGVRKGKGLKPDQEKMMIDHQVPAWYIDSCKKIKYMFPKAHAVAYVIMALRIGWFKVHRPIYYYAAYFSRRAVAFDVEVFVGGRNAIRNKLNEIMEKRSNKTVTNKEEDLYCELEIAYEMVLRGYSFKQIDINQSEARDFVITEDKKSLIMPFSTLDSLGLAAASSIVEARKERPFTSIQDVENRTKINRTVMARLKHLEVFGNLPEEEKSGLF